MADQVGEVNKIGDFGPGQFYYDPSAFAPVDDPRFGTSGRNILTAPGVGNLDLSFSKNFPIHERLRAQFRAEFFNFTNTPQYGRPDRSVTSDSFMQITGASGERVIRVGVRFDF